MRPSLPDVAAKLEDGFVNVYIGTEQSEIVKIRITLATPTDSEFRPIFLARGPCIITQNAVCNVSLSLSLSLSKLPEVA